MPPGPDNLSRLEKACIVTFTFTVLLWFVQPRVDLELTQGLECRVKREGEGVAGLRKPGNFNAANPGPACDSDAVRGPVITACIFSGCGGS